MSRYWSNMVWSILFLAGAYCFWRWCIGYILPFLLGALMAFFLRPISERLENWGLSRATAALGSLVLAGGLVILTMSAVIALLVSEIVQLSQRLPKYVKEWRVLLDHHRGMGEAAISQLHLNPTVLNSSLGGMVRVAEGMLRQLLLFLLHVPDVALVLLLSTLTAFFLLRDHRWASRMALRTLPPGMRTRYREMKYGIVNGTLAFIKAELFLVSVTAAVTTAGLLVAGFRYAVLAGVLAGLLDLLPYLGPTVILGPWAAILLMSGHYLAAAKLGMVLATVAIARQVLEPRLVGTSMGLHPLVALGALYIGIRTFGASGVIVGPLTALGLRVMYQSRHGAIKAS